MFIQTSTGQVIQVFGVYAKSPDDSQYVHMGTGSDFKMAISIARGLQLLAESIHTTPFASSLFVVDANGDLHEVAVDCTVTPLR